MNYKPEHAAHALVIMERLCPLASPRSEYQELIEILRIPHRWKDAHALFNKIRVNVTLPNERMGKRDLDAYLAYVAENAAKTAYNCSGEPAAFDDDSFEWLLKCERDFNDRHAGEPAEPNASPDRRNSSWSWVRRIFIGDR